MTTRTKQIATVLYGCMAFAVGLWRHLETGDSPQAAWFGAAMGALAMLGALLLPLKRRFPGYMLIGMSLAMVGGWFIRRFLTHADDGRSIRVILILVVCAAELCILVAGPHRSTPGRSSANT